MLFIIYQMQSEKFTVLKRDWKLNLGQKDFYAPKPSRRVVTSTW
jgi:hypothetical protein